MGTPAAIGVIRDDKSIVAVRLNYDGYPDYALTTLKEHYTTLENAEALVSLGELSSLGATLLDTEAYHRDKGEEYTEPTEYANVEEFASGYTGNTPDGMGVSYRYAFDSTMKEWIRL